MKMSGSYFFKFRGFLVLFWMIMVIISCQEEGSIKTEEVALFRAADYVDFKAGNIPLVISVPHGGILKPSIIPNRTCNNAVNVLDEFTIELGNAIMVEFAKSGLKPYFIVNKIHRSKMDANRKRMDASCGNLDAQAVWDLFHGHIQNSLKEVDTKFKKGLFIDLHGHGNPKQRIELGYLLYDDELALPNETLNSSELTAVSSIQNLVKNNISGSSHTDLLKGDMAYGSFLEQKGFPSVPSAADPVPLQMDNYFSGGYNTANYSSYMGGAIDGIQLECNRSGLRETQAEREAFAVAFVSATILFLETHYFEELPKL
jgi:N-formylglutamate amidohydrolase